MERTELLAKLEELENQLQNVKGTECEVWSRIVGYFRPVKQWNNGKQEEYEDRVEFAVETAVGKAG
ncbi:MAG: anaerobic ribonucleoside-triphosphate reductase [Spirochaetia bacterium]|nr:anaerobic ribonucleoside-triphosphate reductase [Spirochaetia bacterium]